MTDDAHSSMSHVLCCMKGTYVNKTLFGVSPLGNESVILSPYIWNKLNKNLRNLFKALM